MLSLVSTSLSWYNILAIKIFIDDLECLTLRMKLGIVFVFQFILRCDTRSNVSFTSTCLVRDSYFSLIFWSSALRAAFSLSKSSLSCWRWPWNVSCFSESAVSWWILDSNSLITVAWENVKKNANVAKHCQTLLSKKQINCLCKLTLYGNDIDLLWPEITFDITRERHIQRKCYQQVMTGVAKFQKSNDTIKSFKFVLIKIVH